MQRLVILLSLGVFALTAPARAWCEATCVQPPASAHERAEAPQPHCPAHSQAPGTHVSDARQDQCRQLDLARATAPARQVSPASWKAAPIAAIALPLFALPHLAPPHLASLHVARRTSHSALLSATPLRI